MLRSASALLMLLGLACNNVGCNKEQPPPSPPADSAANSPTDDAGTVEPPTPTDDDAGSDGAASQPATGDKKDAGASCLSADECQSGVCEGEGCSDDTPGTCADASRMCTRDLRQYCGCDGVTFGSSGSCPGQRYAHKEAC